MNKMDFLEGKVSLYGGDSREVLKQIPDNFFDAIVTDPPYGLLFMAKAWDSLDGAAFATEFWAQIYRVLKPGGHVVAFSGTRSYHRLAVAIEDSGFEIRDQLAWVYGSGFPKSHDVSKGIDKTAGVERTVTARGASGRNSLMGGLAGTEGESGHTITQPATPAAQQWQGWGTALKPSWEPIVLARKPLSEKTVAANVLKWGTGALNVDGCRVGTDDNLNGGGYNVDGTSNKQLSEATSYATKVMDKVFIQPKGRWPANICHDGSDEVLAGFPDSKSTKAASTKPMQRQDNDVYGKGLGSISPDNTFDDSGSAARFFYSAKADKLDRIGSKHPTVKPVDLMQWLCRLVTPPGGRILDPFAGSGSTGEAAWREGFDCTLIEREPEYQADIAERLRLADKGPIERKARAIKQTVDHGPLFGGANDNVAGGGGQNSICGDSGTIMPDAHDRGIMAGKGGFGFRITGRG